ncbi:SDR family oxidoreductase [Pontixanthobacter aquaemixtae]|uniref:SDR family oxidoreductase n=1 Tax=Pontixanthobacter aquaemixtae TaxID=1958940 RepID=A0A844ZRG8_9SPHN|nr:SDR family oxidoreductase [Pontixanthobacter aquaemixtae]MXO89912.1 SDR family oxidoreductase [Pontixanthobacter aquaemixtae]
MTEFSLEQFSLGGKVAVVTGAGGRGNSIGRAYAKGLASAGASVVVADLNLEGANAVADEITSSGGSAIAVAVDVAEEASTKAMAAAATEAFGGVDILVNNAALMVDISYDSLETVGMEEWRKAFSVNLDGALLCSRAVVPSMRERGGGAIVNQTSGGAFPASGLYGVTKLALVGLTTSLAKQFGKDNITCNAIAPGNVASDAGKMLAPDGSPFLQFLENVVATKAQGQPDELVGTLLLLCSDAGKWITGQTINVDGGWIMRS